MKTEPGAHDLLPIYLLVVAAGGILAHLASEYAAMGSGADAVLVSARHWYLDVGAIAAIAAIFIRVRALYRSSWGGRDLKRILHVGLDRLPLRGRGAAFAVLTAGLQFSIGMLTEFGEGAPIEGHDVAAGVFGALVVALLLALATKAAASSLPSIVEAIIRLLPAPSSSPNSAFVKSQPPAAAVHQSFWSAHLFNRPPPHLQFAIALS